MELVTEYEVKLDQEKVKKKYGINTNISPRGFGRGFEAEKIIAASFDTGRIFFSVKWKDSEIVDIVPAKEANLKIPELVIEFYEEHMEWGDEEDDLV